jgi:agmatinase
MTARTVPVPEGTSTFAGFPRQDDLRDLAADIAIIGVPEGVPYGTGDEPSPASAAPAAIREASRRWATYLDHVDVDLGGDLFDGRPIRVVDCGDVAIALGQHEANGANTTAVIRRIFEAGAVPIVLGGDHSVPIPVMHGYEGVGSMCVVQIDAHLDWRDEVGGVRLGLSSNMRRASEMPFVTGMAQLGLRGVGSARAREYEDARTYGSVLVSAAEIHRNGIEAALERIPAADRYYVTFDTDGLDPSVAPGVASLAFGGLTYLQSFDILRGVAAKGRIVGFDLVEIVPANDVHNLTSLLGARMILNVIGLMARNGQIGG